MDVSADWGVLCTLLWVGVVATVLYALLQLVSHKNSRGPVIEQQQPVDVVADVDQLDAGDWAVLDKLVDSKLWQQLTMQILDVVKRPTFRGDGTARRLYQDYIAPAHEKMNPLCLVEILRHVVAEYSSVDDADQLLRTTEQVVQQNNVALAAAKLLRGHALLNVRGDIEGTRELLESVRSLLEGHEYFEATVVHGHCHLLASKWHRVRGEHAEAYHEALRYLACVDLSTLSQEDQKDIMESTLISGVVGVDVFDLGILMLHPLLPVLAQVPNAWLVHLLCVVHEGNVTQLVELESQMQLLPIIAENAQLIRTKTKLLCLVQLCVMPDRTLTLRQISKATKTPLEEVESLVMEAIAKGLIRGTLDLVEGNVYVEWVKPGTLQTNQLKTLVKRLNTWCRGMEEEAVILGRKIEDVMNT